MKVVHVKNGTIYKLSVCMASQEFTPIYKPGSGGRWDVQIMHILERFISAVV